MLPEKEIRPLKDFKRARLRVPSSKSLTQRALICSALADGKSRIINPLLSEDPRLLLSALEATGVKATFSENNLIIEGVAGRPNLSGEKVYLGNNGTGTRFFIAYASLGRGSFVEVFGKERLHERPVAPLLSALRSLSANIECLEREGYLPLRIYEGKLKGGKVSLPGNVSSQFISALLLIGPYLSGGLTVEVEGELLSAGYVEMTIEVMKHFGVDVERIMGGFRVKEGFYEETEYEVPADASSSSYFLSIPLILGRGEVYIENYSATSSQPDVAHLTFLKEMGAKIEVLPLGVKVAFEGRPKACEFNISNCPDLFPTLCVLLACAQGKGLIRGAPHLRYKETDRIRAMATELKKLGVEVEELPDGIVIEGREDFKPARINTYDDHRIAMSFAILGLRNGGLIIENPACVEKSYPEFWEHLESVYAQNS